VVSQNRSNNIHSVKVAALTGELNAPGSRFRIRQYIPHLAQQGIVVDDHILFFKKSWPVPSALKRAVARIPSLLRSRDADLVWVSRELVGGYETFERLLKRPRMMDIDDAIWLNWPFGRFVARDIARAMDAVVVGNTYLADYFGRYCKNIYIVPTAVDLNRYKLRPAGCERREKFVIGWTGLASNYKYVNLVEPVLHRFMQEHDRAELMLVSDFAWKSELLPTEKVRFIPWSAENEATVLHSMSVGIMPLPDDEWSRGKCSFKMLQYMAVGLPVVVSPVGMNRELLAKAEVGFAASTPDEWYEALERLYDDRPLQVKLGQAGRQVVERFYNADTVASELARIIKSLAGR
jgi:glycosyltransferase involved in cell wall biosynthesis